MQVFIPEVDFYDIANCLDKKRLFKQVVEARQILATNGVKVPRKSGGYLKPTYIHHPIHPMWADYTDALAIYHDILLEKCLELGFNTTMSCVATTDSADMPPFIGWDPIHQSHRSNLLRKDPAYYGRFGWDVPTDIDYIWDVSKVA